MSQFAWPIYGIELTETISKIWNITDNYADEALSFLYDICNGNCSVGLQVYKPNDEDWYEAYYGIRIDNTNIEDIQQNYKNYISNINEQFQNLIHEIQSSYEAQNFYNALDVTNLAEAVPMLFQLRDYISSQPPHFQAIFTF